MSYKEKIKELRTIIPIPINEALSLLNENNGDIDASVTIFKKRSIEIICSSTGCIEDIAVKYYEREKFDLNRSISMIREDLYDKNYKPIKGVDITALNYVKEWIAFMEDKDFAYALDYKYLSEVINCLLAIPKLKYFASEVQKASKAKHIIFKGYTDDLSIEEFIKRNVQLDDNYDFKKAYESITLSLVSIKEEINRHRRNNIE